MPAVINEVVVKTLEIKDFLLQHWIGVILGGIVLYLLKNKYGNGLNGIPGPFLAGNFLQPIAINLKFRFHRILQALSPRGEQLI